MHISVITSNYNGSRYLEAAIKSVLSQTHRDFEYIIIDDGSTDGSRDIIKRYHDQHRDKIIPIYMNSNRGQGYCFNTAITATKGSIISFIDSDDFWFNSKLDYVSNVFSNINKISLFQHNLRILQDDVTTENTLSDVLYIGDYFKFTQESHILPNFIPTSGLSFRKDFLKLVLPIPSSFKTCADGYLTRTCFCHGPVESFFECLGAYRVHNMNNTYGNSNFSSRRYKKHILLPALNRYYRENGIQLKFKKNFILDLYLNSPRDSLKALFSK
jgi:glycosyltransferase involved in cell wall biosynthesis